MNMNKPLALSEAGAEVLLELDEAKGYRYIINNRCHSDPYLTVVVGVDARKPYASFTHPNIAARAEVVHNFRTYYKSGAKKWYAHPGIDFAFIVPRSKVTLLPEKGYSYIKAEINGVKVSFNVSGGGDGKVWSDDLGHIVHVACNHTKRDLKAIAEVSVPPAIAGFTPILKEQNKKDAEIEKMQFSRLIAAKQGPALLKAAMERGEHPAIFIADGYHFRHDGDFEYLQKIIYNEKLKWGPEDEEGRRKGEYVKTNRVYRYATSLFEKTSETCATWVKPKQVDWLRTVKALQQVSENA